MLVFGLIQIRAFNHDQEGEPDLPTLGPTTAVQLFSLLFPLHPRNHALQSSEMGCVSSPTQLWCGQLSKGGALRGTQLQIPEAFPGQQ